MIKRHEDPSRTTPIGMARYGGEFLEAAFVVNDRSTTAAQHRAMPPVPVLYLLGHGLELTLKAFLLHRGEELATLRGKSLGHDLAACHAQAIRHGLADIFTMHSAESGAFGLLNALYAAKELEYIVTGAKTVPHFPLLQRLAVRLHAVVARDVGYHSTLTPWDLSKHPLIGA